MTDFNGLIFFITIYKEKIQFQIIIHQIEINKKKNNNNKNVYIINRKYKNTYRISIDKELILLPGWQRSEVDQNKGLGNVGRGEIPGGIYKFGGMKVSKGGGGGPGGESLWLARGLPKMGVATS